MRASPHWEMSRVQFLCRRGLESHDRTKDGFNIGSIIFVSIPFSHTIESNTSGLTYLPHDVLFCWWMLYFSALLDIFPFFSCSGRKHQHKSAHQMASHQQPPSNTSVMEKVPRSSPAPFAFFWHRTKNPHQKKPDMVWSCLVYVPILVRFPLLETTTISKFPILDLLFRGA